MKTVVISKDIITPDIATRFASVQAEYEVDNNLSPRSITVVEPTAAAKSLLASGDVHLPTN